MSDQRPPSFPWVDLWRTTVSGAVAICSVTACAAIVFAGLAFTHGGAQISYHDLNISLPAHADSAPPLLVAAPTPPPPPAAPIAHLAIPYLGILYRETTVNPDNEPGALGRVLFSAEGRLLATINGSEPPASLDLSGARVLAVRPDSPAEGVGLQAGDVIVAVDGKPLVYGLDLRNRIRGANVGQEVTLHLYRGDRLIRVPVSLGTLPLGEE